MESNNNENDNDNDDDMAGEMDTGESMGAKMRQRKNDEPEYDEEEGDEDGKSDDDDEDDEEVVLPNQSATNDESEILQDDVIRLGSSKKMSKQRVKNVLNISDIIGSYSYDIENQRWFNVAFKVIKD